MAHAPQYLHMVYPDTEFRALLYGRNSRDPQQQTRSVDDQLSSGRELCDRYNWHVDEVFRDQGISASRYARRDRDDFEDLLDAIENRPTPPGAIRIAVAFSASRYYRDLEAYVRLRNACYNAGVLLCYNGMVYDLSTREDRKATAQDALQAEDEVEGIRDQNVRTAQQTAKAGRPFGKLPYGYARRYDLVNGRQQCVEQYEHPVGGQVVFRSLEHIDGGGSLYSLVKWLRGTPEAARPDGVEWSEKRAKYMLLNRVYLGERLYDGRYIKATWAPIRGLETPEGRALFRRVTQKLTAPERRSQRDSQVAHLLSRIALCGECGDHALLTAGKRNRGVRYLNCVTGQDTALGEERFDAYVETAVIAWLRDKSAARAALVPDSRKLAADTARAQELVDAYTEELDEARALARQRNAAGRPRLSVTSLAMLEEDLLPKIENERSRLEHATGVPAVLHRLLAAEDPADVWDGVPATETEPARPGMTLEQKRAALRLICTIRLYKASRPGIRTIEPGRIRISFRGEPGFRDVPLRGRALAPVPPPRPGSAGARRA